ncbi:hypothetical protein FKP32DRAFT_1151816 [Trametes sanguinea]|nr:hypothetical protein FKP32DRAFT_1151816 [Trametes sanguinea]
MRVPQTNPLDPIRSLSTANGDEALIIFDSLSLSASSFSRHVLLHLHKHNFRNLLTARCLAWLASPAACSRSSACSTSVLVENTFAADDAPCARVALPSRSKSRKRRAVQPATSRELQRLCKSPSCAARLRDRAKGVRNLISFSQKFPVMRPHGWEQKEMQLQKSLLGRR